MHELIKGSKNQALLAEHSLEAVEEAVLQPDALLSLQVKHAVHKSTCCQKG